MALFPFFCVESEEREGNLLLPRCNVEDGNGWGLGSFVESLDLKTIPLGHSQ